MVQRTPVFPAIPSHKVAALPVLFLLVYCCDGKKIPAISNDVSYRCCSPDWAESIASLAWDPRTRQSKCDSSFFFQIDTLLWIGKAIGIIFLLLTPHLKCIFISLYFNSIQCILIKQLFAPLGVIEPPFQLYPMLSKAVKVKAYLNFYTESASLIFSLCRTSGISEHGQIHAFAVHSRLSWTKPINTAVRN